MRYTTLKAKIIKLNLKVSNMVRYIIEQGDMIENSSSISSALFINKNDSIMLIVEELLEFEDVEIGYNGERKLVEFMDIVADKSWRTADIIALTNR